MLARPDRSALLEYTDSLYRLLYRRVRDHHAAEDLTHDALTRALVKWDQYDPARSEGKLWRWLATIALRLLAEWARSGKLKYHAPLPTDAADSAHATAAPPALDLVVRAEDAARLRAGIDALTAAQRETVLLYYFDDLPATEIAEIFAVSVGTIYGRLSVARNRLQAALGLSTTAGGPEISHAPRIVPENRP